MNRSADRADMSAQISALRLIVDDLDYGIVVLDRERHVQFVNGAFRRFWKIPDGLAESQPTFVKLMYHGRGVETYAVSHDRLGDYVAQQLALIRSGEERPLNIELRGGSVLQFRCRALPDGGRLLTYGNISELYRQAEAIERLACVDGMTGLSNRRHFLALAENEWSRFRRYGRPLSALMLDIDLFKSVNDTYGHDAGDEVIKAVADILQNNKRTLRYRRTAGRRRVRGDLPGNNARERCRRRRTAAATGRRRMIAAATDRIMVTISVGASICREETSGIDPIAQRSGRRALRRQARRPRPCLPVCAETAGGAALNLKPLELQLGEPRVKPAIGDERLVGAFFDDAAFVHHQDAVAGEHGRQPMRDHDRGTLAHQLRQRGGDLRFALRIERRRRLVEQKERRVAQNGACDGDPLGADRPTA